MEPRLSNYLERFCQSHDTQRALLRMTESWRALLNKGQKVVTIIMDLPKAFNNINHKKPFKKLHAYGFDKKSLSLKAILLTENKELK